MTSAAQSFISVKGLTKRYSRATVLDDISFSVSQGEFLTLLGPSGCGKTTTLRCIAGFIRADEGRILLAGKELTDVPPYKRDLGMVFQNYALFPHLNVFDNVGFGLDVRQVPRAEARSRIHAALEMVRLGGLSERYPKQLSGGQQQRVALARALVYQPRVLLLDEPLSNLDAKLRIEMRSEIRALQQKLGITALYVTHDQEEALSVSDRVMVMNMGRVEQLSTPWELYNRPLTSFVARFIGTSNLLPAKRQDGTGMMSVAGAFLVPEAAAGGAEEATFVVRPENVTLEPPTSPIARPGAARGRVHAITLLGATMRIDVVLASGVSLVVDRPHGGRVPNLAAGDEVVAVIDMSMTTALPANSN